MEDSDSMPCAQDDGLLTSWRWNRNAREQVQLKQKLRDLPGLLKHGLHLRKKRQSPDTIPGPSAGLSEHMTCSQSFPCAGRALRNAFLSHGPYPAKDKIHLARIIRRSYVGVELVQWLLEQCVFVQCRMMASRVWQVLLELGILLSVDQRAVFDDSNTYYQFSFEECKEQDCEFRNEGAWPSNDRAWPSNEGAWHNAVRLLLTLVPYVQFRSPVEEPDDRRDMCSEILQMKALERLTSTVQNELAAALARKVQKSMSEEDQTEQTDSATQDSLPPSDDQAKGGLCAPPQDHLSRLEMVQKLAKDGCHIFQNQNYKLPDRNNGGDPTGRVCLKERGQDVLVLQRVSERPTGGVREEDNDRRYVVVSGTPQKILEHLLSDLRLDNQQGATESRESEMLLDDFLLTYLVFMSTHDLCQALLGHYCTKRCRGKEEEKEALYRKRKVLHLVTQWSSLYRDFLREEEHVKMFMKTLYRYVLEDIYEFPSLERDLKDIQKLLRRRHTVDDYSPHQKNKALFQQLSLKENALQQPGGMQKETKEVLGRVYVSPDSYLSMRTQPTAVAQDLLRIAAQKIGCNEEDTVLVSITHPGEKRVLQSHDSIYSESLVAAGRLMVCKKDLTEIMGPLIDNCEMGQKIIPLLEMNTWDVAAALTNFDWSLFSSIHEQELIYFTLSRQASSGHTVALETLLQRCNELQQWVMSEVMLCSPLTKRVQLLKKFIKIAAHCKTQRNLNSSFAIIMGLNTAAVSRLNQTWEKVPGKFKKLFSELELLTDPSLNHKAYRDDFRKMKNPKIPFMPLLLKDITFIHEGNKTFHDNLVNFEKLHMIADTVRLIRFCQTDHTGNEVASSDSPEVRASVHYLHIIDNQQTLFQLSHKLEPRV